MGVVGTKPPATGGGGTDRRSLTGRIFRVLDAFADTGDSLTPAEVVRRTGLPKTTAHRILNDLVHAGALTRTERGLSLGVHLFELGSVVPANRRLREIAVPFMEDLYEASHEVVHLGILDGSDVLYLVKISGHERVPLPTRDGARMPVHATALGKTLLAASPRAVVRRLLDQPLRALTPRTIVAKDVLWAELAEAARTGVAFDHEEAVTGVVCVAAPITVTGFQSHAAISVTGPPDRFDPQHAAAAVRLAGFAISRSVNGPDRGPPDAPVPEHRDVPESGTPRLPPGRPGQTPSMWSE
ncbi:MAG: IclR family transcriptional regulator [Acidimicrobiia bacterium]